MSDVASLEDMTASLSKPYVATRSKLGSTTKLIEQKFTCGCRELLGLQAAIGEKLRYLNPTKAGFQFLVSFTDSTHYENTNLADLENVISSSDKCVDKVILNWIIAHYLDGIENEMRITVRISNPINPLTLFQAALSKDHSEFDNLDFELGAVSVSVNGATQNTSEEIFNIVSRWAKAAPNPQSFVTIHQKIQNNLPRIFIMNDWVFPMLFVFGCFFWLKMLPVSDVQPYSLLAFCSFMFVRSAAANFNSRIDAWARRSQVYSIFNITGGDKNRQTKVAARSQNSTLKLIGSVILSLIVNLIAGGVLYYLTK
ncbi:hypothetical protein ACPFUK_002411 [Vibrio cholerae]